MLKNYLKTALRNLWKNKTYSFLNIFGLAVGIACAGLIFLWLEDELNYNHGNAKKDQLYQILQNQSYEGKTYTFASTPGLLAETMKQEIPGVKNTCRFTWQEYTLFGLGDKLIYERGYYADSSIFSMFTLPFVQGKKENAFQQLHSLVISEKMAKKFFPDDQNIIGEALKVDNKEEYFISGVIKDLPENSTIQFDWLAPFKIYFDKNDWLLNWGNNGIQTFAELENQADAQVNKKLYLYIKRKDTSALARPFLLSMNDWRLRSKFEEGKQVGGRIQYVKMFTTIAWIILLIACINFMNLATARSEKRAREVGVRKILGAQKTILVGQFIGEAVFMSFVSVFVGVLLMYLLLPFFNVLVAKHLSIGLGKPLHLYSLIAIGLLCGIVAGSYPAFHLSSFNPIRVFKDLNIKGNAPALVRKGLVILQFTISIVLIIGTIIIYQQIQHIKNRDLGYDKENLIQTALRGDMQKNFQSIKNDLLSTGYVKNVAMSDLNMLYMGSNTNDYRWEGKDPSKQILITQDYVTPDYLTTTGVKVKEGRDFYADGKDSMGVIINETFAKIIGKDAVGKTLRRDTSGTGGVDYTIVGVANDFVYGDMYAKPDPLVFMCYTPYSKNFGYMYLRLKSQINTEKAVADITTIIKKNNSGYPFEYIFVDNEFNLQFKSEMLIGKLSRVFALLAIIISCLGLFGLAAYTAERRTKEIGIRKVLGASVTRITGLLSKDFLRLVFISAVVAFPISWWFMHKWLQNYAYRVSINWWVFVIAGLLALLIALITISFQSIRAAIANPVKSLRTE